MSTNKKGAMTLGVADANHIFREHIVGVISTECGSYRVVGERGSITETVAFCRRSRPDILLLNMNIGGELRNPLVGALRRAHPGLRLILWSGFLSHLQIAHAIRDGVSGFVEEGAGKRAFVEGMNRFASEGSYFAANALQVALRLAQGQEPGQKLKTGKPLTPRERDVMALIAAGLTTRSVAERLSIATSTAETHRSSLMAKTGAHNAAQLIRIAREQGLA